MTKPRDHRPARSPARGGDVVRVPRARARTRATAEEPRPSRTPPHEDSRDPLALAAAEALLTFARGRWATASRHRHGRALPRGHPRWHRRPSGGPGSGRVGCPGAKGTPSTCPISVVNQLRGAPAGRPERVGIESRPPEDIGVEGGAADNLPGAHRRTPWQPPAEPAHGDDRQPRRAGLHAGLDRAGLGRRAGRPRRRETVTREPVIGRRPVTHGTHAGGLECDVPCVRDGVRHGGSPNQCGQGNHIGHCGTTRCRGAPKSCR